MNCATLGGRAVEDAIGIGRWLQASERGAWPELRERIAAVYRGANLATDPTLAFEQEYLLAIGNKPEVRRRLNS